MSRSYVDVRAIAAGAERELRAAGTPERADSEKAYLRSALEHAGASVPSIRRCAGRIRREHPDLDADDVMALASELWSVELYERRLVAVVLLERYVDRLGSGTVTELEPFLRTSYTWALVDGLAGSVVATIIARDATDPPLDDRLRRWAADEDFWVRRAALLAHLGTLGRTGDFSGWDRFNDIAGTMLVEREFFIRKAIGWVLREAGRSRPGLVADWVRPRTQLISGVTIREAVRYLNEEDREELMAAYRRSRR